MHDLKSANTDEQIIDQVYQALQASGYGQLRNLQAYCENGRVTLQGRLPSHYLKEVAKSIVLEVPGIRDIDNDVKVQSYK